jgi:cell division control protein 6
MPRERNLILYNLCDLNKVGLICICASQDFLFSLDERVRSRLNPRIIEFRTYSPIELYEILKDRARSALRDNSWNHKILRRIVSMANGDARIAIQTLRHAANIAENQGISRIKIRHLEKGSLDAKDFKVNKILSSLTVHHRLIYGLIKARKEILSGRLWEGYQLQCKKIQIRPVPSRTFAYYRNQLINTGLISSRRAGIRGNVRIYSINKNSLQMRIRSYC